MQVTLNISQDKPAIENQFIPVPLSLLLLLFCSFDFTELRNCRWLEKSSKIISVAFYNARSDCFTFSPTPTRKLRYCLSDKDIKKKKETTRLKWNISELNNFEKFHNQTELNFLFNDLFQEAGSRRQTSLIHKMLKRCSAVKSLSFLIRCFFECDI